MGFFIFKYITNKNVSISQSSHIVYDITKNGLILIEYAEKTKKNKTYGLKGLNNFVNSFTSLRNSIP